MALSPTWMNARDGRSLTDGTGRLAGQADELIGVRYGGTAQKLFRIEQTQLARQLRSRSQIIREAWIRAHRPCDGPVVQHRARMRSLSTISASRTLGPVWDRGTVVETRQSWPVSAPGVHWPLRRFLTAVLATCGGGASARREREHLAPGRERPLTRRYRRSLWGCTCTPAVRSRGPSPRSSHRRRGL